MQNTVSKELKEVIERQDKKGIETYGVSLDNADLSTSELIDHAVEELVDLSKYLIALKRKLEEGV